MSRTDEWKGGWTAGIESRLVRSSLKRAEEWERGWFI